MRTIGPLDHVIVLVRDLGLAEAAMSRLGFRPTPRGLHSAEMGTANATIMFGDGTYFELLAVVSETPLNQQFVAQLREREGPAGIAMKTDDARAAAEEFAAAGIASGPAVEFARPVELQAGTREAAFTIARLDPAATPGAWMFVCQHHTPEVVWREDFLAQPNGVTGLAEVVGVAADLDRIEPFYRRLFGDRARREEDALVVATGTAALRYLAPLAFTERFGRMARQAGPHLEALVFDVADLEQTRAVLDAAGTPSVRSDEGTLIVPPRAASGALFEFVERPPRGSPRQPPD